MSATARIFLLALTARAAPMLAEGEPPKRLPVDREAMAEAMAESPELATPFSSPPALLHYVLGCLAADRGDPARAIEELRQALVLDQTSAHVAVRLAEQYWRLGLGDRAEGVLRGALATETQSAEAHEALGSLLLQTGRLEEAARELRRSVDLDPARGGAWRSLAQVERQLGDDARLGATLDAWARAVPGELGWRDIGVDYLERGDLDHAEHFLRRALDFVPEDPATLAALGKLADQRHEEELAFGFFERSVRSNPADGSALFELARHHLRHAALAKDPAADLAAARAYFNSMVATADEEAPARAEVGLAYARANLLSDALAQIEAAVAADPDSPRWRYYRGLVEQQLGRANLAAADFGAVPASDEAFVDAAARRGEVLQRAGRHREAVAGLLGALELRPTAAPLYASLSRVYTAAGDAGAAVALLERVADQQGLSTEISVALADAYEAGGRRGRAIALLEKVLAARPGDETLLFDVGSELARAGRIDEAIARMRQILKVDPRSAAAMNFIGFELADRSQRLDEAEALVRAALSLEPESGLIEDSLGWVYFKQGRLRLAVETLKRASRASPREPLILEHLGEAYARQGAAREAARSYGRALELLRSHPDDPLRASLARKLEELAGRTAAAGSR